MTSVEARLLCEILSGSTRVMRYLQYPAEELKNKQIPRTSSRYMTKLLVLVLTENGCLMF